MRTMKVEIWLQYKAEISELKFTCLIGKKKKQQEMKSHCWRETSIKGSEIKQIIKKIGVP